MPRIDKTMLKGLDLAKFVSAERTVGSEVLEVTVLSDETIFERFVDSIYSAVSTNWEMFHMGQNFPVAREEFMRYAYTAVGARVARVVNTRFNVRCDDSWALPAPIAAILAGIGKVQLELPMVSIVPKWDSRHDDKLLSYQEWGDISRRMRAAEKDSNCKFVFAHAIEGGTVGDDALMALIPVRDATGRIIQLEGPGSMDIDPIAAMAYLILGLEPVGEEGTALPTFVLRSSPYYLKVVGILAFIDRLAEASVA